MVIEKGEVKCKILFYMGLHKRRLHKRRGLAAAICTHARVRADPLYHVTPAAKPWRCGIKSYGTLSAAGSKKSAIFGLRYGASITFI